MEDTIGDPFAVPLPSVDSTEAETIASELFGVHGIASPLESERDRNFRIETSAGDRYLLKVHNSAEDPAFIEMQDAAMAHIRAADPSIPVAEARASVTG